MKNFKMLSRAEMKDIKGGVADIICTITVLGSDGYTESGACASSDMETCLGYTATKAALYSQANGYSGANYSCS